MADVPTTRPLLILLPGLDGSGRLFARLVAALGADVDARVIAYPADRALGYAELVEFVRPQLPKDRPFVLLGVDVRKEAAEVEVPVLVIRATRDRVVPDAATRVLLEVLPQATPVDLDAPHFLLQVTSGAAAAELKRFAVEPR